MNQARDAGREAGTMSAAMERVFEADRRFFERFPHRNHLVRYTARTELADLVEAEKAFGAAEVPTPPGYRWFTIVRQVAPGVRLRAFTPARSDDPVDVMEAEARNLYERHVSEQGRDMERRLRLALRKAGLP